MKRLFAISFLFTALIFDILLAALLIFPSAGLAGTNQWTTNGPFGGNVSSLAVSPNFASDRTLFAGTFGGGVFSYTYTAGDTTPPAVSSVSPSGWINTASPTISADYSDSGSGINTASVAVYLDGRTPPGCTATATLVSCLASGLTDGSHYKCQVTPRFPKLSDSNLPAPGV